MLFEKIVVNLLGVFFDETKTKRYEHHINAVNIGFVITHSG